ncbi:hypothetical protein DFJ74DRAFT_712997 [Hyaloraphidium curvatum]|nr:hypothetical protein DFJ74DRAFT_712997 [Hyaloraphidium curvatum]
MVVRVVAIIHPKDGKLDEVAKNYLDVMPLIWAEKGVSLVVLARNVLTLIANCIEYHLNKTADGSLVMIETWASMEDLRTHGSGEPVAQARAKNKDLLGKPAEILILSPADPDGPTGPKAN